MSDYIHIGNNTICGDNVVNNWKIIADSKPSHTWVHLKSFPSAHVVIRSVNPTDEDIMYAAKLCKNESKFKNVGNIKAVYSKVKNLRLDPERGVVFESSDCNEVKVV